MIRNVLVSALALVAFAVPAISQTSQFPAVPPAGESVRQRQIRYNDWRAANGDITERIAAYVTAVRSQAASFTMPAEGAREWLRRERFAEIVTAAAIVQPSARDEARAMTTTAARLIESENYDAASLLLGRALETDPGSGEAAYLLSSVLRRQGRSVEVYRLLQRALAFSAPNSAEEALATVELRNRPMMIIDTISRPALVWDCAMCPEMAVIPAGGFSGLFSDTPYAIGRFEITFDEWSACVENGGCRSNPRPRSIEGRGRRPVGGVSWDDAQEYVHWLSATTNEDYFLPSDGQWEFAARAGALGAHYWGDDPSAGMADSHAFANFGTDTTSGDLRMGLSLGRDAWAGPAPVGQFPPNNFGVFDTAGNVAEWTAGCFQQGTASGPCTMRVTRGGAYHSSGSELAVGRFRPVANDSRSVDTGFRVARALGDRDDASLP